MQRMRRSSANSSDSRNWPVSSECSVTFNRWHSNRENLVCWYLARYFFGVPEYSLMHSSLSEYQIRALVQSISAFFRFLLQIAAENRVFDKEFLS